MTKLYDACLKRLQKVNESIESLKADPMSRLANGMQSPIPNPLTDEQKQKLTKLNQLSNNYKLYILYCNPTEDLDLLNWSVSKQIKSNYLTTPNCPAKTYYNNKCGIIIINSCVISRSSTELELYVDHELNHLFEKLSNKQDIPDLDEQIQEEIKNYFKKYNIISIDELDSEDFFIHMFSNEEFYEMISDVCNVLSLYFNEKNDIHIFNKLNNMLTEQYMQSEEFQKLNEPLRGAIIFAFICKKYDLKRWKIVLSYVRSQLNLTGLIGSSKYYMNKILKSLKKLVKL